MGRENGNKETGKKKSLTRDVKFAYFKTVGHIAIIFFLGFSVFLVISTIMLIFLTKPAKEVRVPDVEGKRFIEAYNAIIRKGIQPNIKFRDVFEVEDGIILHQYPEKGRIVPENSTLKLVVSRSRYLIDVPALSGLELPKAINKLKSLHYYDKTIYLATGIISYIATDKVPENVVIDQDPKAGEKITPARKINLLISSGKKEKDTAVPDVTGQSIDLCFDLLLAKGLMVNEEIVATGDRDKSGIIISQNPQKGSPLQKGGMINLQVLWCPLQEHPYIAYEKVSYTIPNGEKEGLYEAYIEDSSSKRVRFSRTMRPGQAIQFVFNRTGNARITIVCNKQRIGVISIDAENY